MHLTVDDVVVHPVHGPATVRSIRARRVKSQLIEYVDLDVLAEPLIVSCPIDQLEATGVRSVLDATQVAAVFAVLRQDGEAEESVWARRLKASWLRLSTRDPFEIAALTRDLHRRRVQSGLSIAEKDLLDLAKRPLLAELSMSMGCTLDEAEKLVEDAIVEEGHEARLVHGTYSAESAPRDRLLD